MTRLCKAHGCRHASTHVTSNHKCGSCGNFGHGTVECGDAILIERLDPYQHETMAKEMRCSVIGCQYATGHTVEAHHCSLCGSLHEEIECKYKEHDSIIISESRLPSSVVYGATKLMLDTAGPIFVTVYGGMGCIWYIKRASRRGKLYGCFMHSDNWGQYGKSTDHSHVLEKFLEGYSKLESK